MVEKIVSAPQTPPSDFINPRTEQAKLLINAGKLRADDTRTMIYAEELEQFERWCTQGCSVVV